MYKSVRRSASKVLTAKLKEISYTRIEPKRTLDNVLKCIYLGVRSQKLCNSGSRDQSNTDFLRGETPNDQKF